MLTPIKVQRPRRPCWLYCRWVVNRGLGCHWSLRSAAIGCDYMWTCDSRSSVEWFQRSCDHLRSTAIICEPGLNSECDIWFGPHPHQISQGRNLALIILILLLIKHFKNVYNLCDRGFLPGSVGGLQAPTNWILSIVTQAWSLVR